MANIKVVSPDGQPGEIPAEQLGDAVEQGYRELTPEVQHELDRHEKYGGVLGAIGATVAGGARGATMGLSDLALTKTGLVEPQTLTDIKDEYPTLSTASEVAGTLAPIVGELGIGGKVASALSKASPVSATTALGAGVERTVAEALGNRLAGKLGGAAARGATEAELFNLGHNISEASLGDEKLTAERLLAHSGDALAVGAGLGFGIAGTGLALKAAAQKTADALNGLSSFVAEKFPLANPDVLNNYAEKTAARVGMQPEEVKALFPKVGTKEGQELRANLRTAEFVTPEERDQLNRTFKQHLEDARKAVGETKTKAFEEFRPREIETLVADLDPKLASEAAYKLADDIHNAAAAMRSNPDIYSAKGLISKLESIEDGFSTRLLKIEKPEELYTLINETKQTLDKQVMKWGKSIAPENAATVDEITKLRSALRDHLEDETIWGTAAARQSAFNDAASRLATAEQNLFGKGSKVGAFGTTRIGRGGRPQIELSTKKINTFLSQTGAARSETQEAALREYLEAARNFTAQAEQSAAAAKSDFSRAGVDSLLGKAKAVADEAEKKLALESKVRQAARLDDIGYNMFPGTAAAAMGAAMGSIPGAAAVGLGAKAVGGAITDAVASRSNPIAMAKTLSRIEGFALGPAKEMARAIETMTKAAETVGETAVKREVGVAAKQIVQRDEDALTRFQRAQDRVRDVASSGLAQTAAYQAALSTMGDHAPRTQRALVDQQMRVAAFLQSKLPTNPFASATTNPRASTWRPSDAEMARYNRFHQAATNPIGSIKAATEGRVSAEAVEAIKTLYPGIYNDFREQLFQRVAMTGKPIPRQSAVALSLMFDVPLTPSMQPQVRAALRMAPQPEKKPSDKPRMPPAHSAAADGMRTDEQARAER